MMWTFLEEYIRPHSQWFEYVMESDQTFGLDLINWTAPIRKPIDRLLGEVTLRYAMMNRESVAASSSPRDDDVFR